MIIMSADHKSIEQQKNHGKILQIIGAVIDIEFNRDEVPKIYDALKF